LLPEPAAFGLFLFATITLNLTPGPDTLYVIARSAGQGRRAGVVSAMGIGAGTIVHITAAAIGLSALLMSSAIAFDLVRFAGAVYLLYLGIRTLTGRTNQVHAGRAAPLGIGRVFRQGVITNVLNPKVALFFLAFIPQFVDPARGSVAWQFVLLGGIFDISGTIVNTVVALAAGSISRWLSGSPRAARAQRWFTGGVFVALGARLALVGQR
jgi:threonine/homoserine/homoserine lactone efflux protein